MRKNGKNNRARVFLILLPVVLFFLPASSYGHVFLHHSEPRSGSSVAPAPERVRIWFDGDLEPVFSKITVKDAGGKQVDKGDSEVDRADPKLLHVGVSALPPRQIPGGLGRCIPGRTPYDRRFHVYGPVICT